MRNPQRSRTLARPHSGARRSRTLTALAASGTVVVAVALMLVTGHAAAAAGGLTVNIGATQVGQQSTVTASGGKSAEGSLTVELRPPGNGWRDVTGSCSGTGVGQTAWSCTLVASGERPLGDHKVRVTQVIDGAPNVVTAHFVVVPPPALAAPAAPSPSPTPTTTTTPTPTPTTSATPTPTPSVTVSPPQRPVPIDRPVVRDPERRSPTPLPDPPTLALPEPAPPAAQPVVQPEVELPTESFAAPDDVSRAFAPFESIDRNDPAAPSALSEGLPDVWRDPLRLLYAVGLGALFLLLVAIPAEVLNSTLEANAHRWRWMYAWALPAVERVSAFVKTLPSWGSSAPVVIVLTSIAFGFADPNFGFDLTSLRLVASLAIGLLLVVHVPSAITALLLGRRWSVPSAIITQPGAIIIAVLGVLASRMLEFSPGLLIGLVLGIELAAGARAIDQRRAIVTRMIVTLAVSVTAWIAYSVLAGALSGSDETFLSIFVIETLVAAVHEGITGLLVALLPLVFLDGKTLFDSSKLAWVALAGPTAIAFALLVLPTSDRLAHDAPVVLWLGVFIGFCLTVAAIWAAFRVLALREERAAAASAEHEPAKDYVA
ncbi:hypothetical protein [Microcella sp.]|uniref:hypothetical protein n=1 Tax=Microcella sp. TaxID=1913979 RepID=UPI0039194CF1